MSLQNHQLINQHNKVVVKNLLIANTFISRFKGLMGTSQLSSDAGLLIIPCQQVHTHFMSYALDIVFIDGQDKVIAIISEVKPWGFTKYVKRSKAVLELPSNTANNKVAVGDTLVVVKALNRIKSNEIKEVGSFTR